MKKKPRKSTRKKASSSSTVRGDAPRPPEAHRRIIAAPSAETKARAIKRASKLVVALSKRWAGEGVPRDVVIGSLAAIVAGSGDRAPIAELFTALESMDLVGVTAIEILLRIVENRPEFVPGVRRGPLLASGAEPAEIDVDVGQRTVLELMPSARTVSCSLLGGDSLRHEIVVDGAAPRIDIRVDESGTWLVGILAASSSDESGVLVLDLVTVRARSELTR
jgi:hypothetical protein